MRSLAWWGPVLAGVEFWSGVSLVGWGVWVFVDPRPLADFVVYEPLVQSLPDDFWACSAIAVGLGQVVARGIDRGGARLLAAFLAMLLYKIIAVGNMVSDQPGPASLVLCGVALANAAVLIRVAR